MLAETVADTDGQTLGILKYKIRMRVACVLVGWRCYTIQYHNTESMLPPTVDRWPRTILVCAKGMLTKIKRFKFAPKNTSVSDGFEFSG